MASSKASNNNESSHQQQSQSNEHISPLTDKHYLTSLQEKSKVICDDMVYYCFDVLNSYFHNNQTPSPKFTNNEFPLFGTCLNYLIN